MPQFILDQGSREAAKRFKALDSFTQGYIEAMFFTSTGSADDEELENATVADLSENAWQAIIRDCSAFLASNQGDIDLACDYAPDEYDEASAGRDFWYTRNHHGVGFWDRGFGDIGDTGTIGCRLTKAAQIFPETDLYLGDDKLLYLS